MNRRLSLLTALAAAALLAACSKSNDVPNKEATPASGSGSANAAISAAPPAASASAAQKPGIPTLVPEPFEPAKGMDFYPIEGALMVVKDLRVGRIVGEGIEWVGTIHDTNRALGGSQINSVHGVWPDGVDVLYSSLNGRAVQPTIYPLTGPKGAAVTFAPGGGHGFFVGEARLGKTTIAAGYDFLSGYRFDTMRGPGLRIAPITADKVGCTLEEVKNQTIMGNIPLDAAVAVPFGAVTATDKGTLITVGNLCDRDGNPVAEVWDKPGKSRIIDLKQWLKKGVGYYLRLVRGKGDEAFLGSHPVLRYHDGNFEPLPATETPFASLFMSPAGKLHGLSGRAILRYDEGQWSPVARLPYKMSFSAIGMDEAGTIWVSHDGASRLRTSQTPDIEGGCKTPFVYLYDVSWKNDDKYTYPTTRKALSTFPQVGDVSLVEYWEGRRSLGIKVKSREQGEAVVAHIKATMKDEHPDLTCYEPKKNIRVIALNAK